MCRAQVEGLTVVIGCPVFVGLLLTVPSLGKRVSVLFAHRFPVDQPRENLARATVYGWEYAGFIWDPFDSLISTHEISGFARMRRCLIRCSRTEDENAGTVR